MTIIAENKTNKFQVITLGGCVVHEIGKCLNEDYFIHQDHLWRRPTIALMSDPVENYSFKTSLIPDRYVSYFINDVTGFHRNQLDTIDRESVIILDILRDIHTGVVEIEDGKYALNPIDGIGILHDISEETMSLQILAEILKNKNPKTINAIVNENEHFELWTEYIRKLATFLISRFRAVIVPEAYFISKSLELHDEHALDEDRAHLVNPVLKRMYTYLREHTDIILVSIPDDRILTGSDVLWGGPSSTHIIDESYALYCTEIDRLIRGLEAPDTFYLEKIAFSRAQQHAHEQKHKLRALNQVNELTQRIDTLQSSIVNLQKQLSLHQNELRQTKNELTQTQGRALEAMQGTIKAQQELLTVQTERLQLRSELNSVLEAHHQTRLHLETGHRRIDALKSELRKPLTHHVKKSFARTTRRLRGASQ